MGIVHFITAPPRMSSLNSACPAIKTNRVWRCCPAAAGKGRPAPFKTLRGCLQASPWTDTWVTHGRAVALTYDLQRGSRERNSGPGSATGGVSASRNRPRSARETPRWLMHRSPAVQELLIGRGDVL